MDKSSPTVGGYFGLELAQGSFPHSGGILLNSGRACLEVILRHRRPTLIHVPSYTCDAVVEPMARLGIAVSMYPISANLEPRSLPSPGNDEMLIINNYFGLQDRRCVALAEEFGDRLIVDCSQAFHAPPAGNGAYTFYSPRKFCGVADGGILYGEVDSAAINLPTDRSWERSSYLLQRLDEGARAGYSKFRHSDVGLSGVLPMRMSNLTYRLLQAYDHNEARLRRRANFAILHDALNGQNAFLPPPQDAFTCPMIYPFRSIKTGLRQRLIDANIFVATYWPNVRDWCEPDSVEYQLTESILPLPIDQRYDENDMQRILAIIS